MLIKLNDLIVRDTKIIGAKKVDNTWEVDVEGKTPSSHYWCILKGEDAIAFENKMNELCK